MRQRGGAVALLCPLGSALPRVDDREVHETIEDGSDHTTIPIFPDEEMVMVQCDLHPTSLRRVVRYVALIDDVVDEFIGTDDSIRIVLEERVHVPSRGCLENIEDAVDG